MAHNKAIIQSMTPLERENPQILNASRKKRIAAPARPWWMSTAC